MVGAEASMTGNHNGCISSLEELLNKPLQWVVCLIHTNELPLRHVFTMLDGGTRRPDSFSGPIGKSLSGEVSSWNVAANLKSIPKPLFINVVAELKVVLKLITLGVKFQECAAHSNKSNNSKLTLERNLLIVLTAKR